MNFYRAQEQQRAIRRTCIKPVLARNNQIMHTSLTASTVYTDLQICISAGRIRSRGINTLTMQEICSHVSRILEEDENREEVYLISAAIRKESMNMRTSKAETGVSSIHWNHSIALENADCAQRSQNKAIYSTDHTTKRLEPELP